MKKTKYLYGKQDNFESFLKTGSPLWFRDLYSLNRLENQLIRDDESIKSHLVNSDKIDKITLDGRDFKLAKNTSFEINLPTRRCHVLCLSNSRNNNVLFKRFNADVCIELNVDYIIGMIKVANEHKRLNIIGAEVDYFKKGEAPLSHDPFELVFKKEYEKYFVEDEYRIAIFWPYDEDTTILTTENNRINVFGKQASYNDHIEFSFNRSDLKHIIANIFYS